MVLARPGASPRNLFSLNGKSKNGVGWMGNRHTVSSRFHRMRIQTHIFRRVRNLHTFGGHGVSIIQFVNLKKQIMNCKSIWRYSYVNIDVLMFCCQRRLENRHSNTSFPRIVGRILWNNATLHGFSSTGRFAANSFCTDYKIEKRFWMNGISTHVFFTFSPNRD